ncbi:MAG: hypothetical protein ACRDRI_06805 [Pseudonocardiaceae bacterium]
MNAHQRAGVLRCDGCWNAATAELPATPSALRDAERLVVRVLPTWDITTEHRDTVQTVTHSLLQSAITEQTAAMITFVLIRHIDWIIVEIRQAVTWSPGAVMLLSLSQPSGRYWCHDAQGQLCGRLLWCGVRTTPQPHPTQHAPTAGASRVVRGGYRPRLG